MPFFTQSRFPTLWKIFQYSIGGTIDKRKLCILKYRGQKQVLEIGCSLGNIAKAFQKQFQIDYTGIDIDPVVIRYAEKDFAPWHNFRFLCQDFDGFVRETNHKFDYILFAGIFHHIDDQLCKSMLEVSQQIMPDEGIVVVVDLLMPEPQDNWFIHWFINLEQGKYVRKESEMYSILSNIPGLQLKEAEVHYVGATPFSLPKCAKFGVYVLSQTK